VTSGQITKNVIDRELRVRYSHCVKVSIRWFFI